jgi:hypothetical protein
MKIKMKHKRAQSIPTNTIIILVLGLVVLALLILYFTGGMQSLWKQIQQKAGIVSGSESEAREMCNAWCSVGNKEVCTHKFSIDINGKTVQKTCPDLGVTCSVCTA